MPSIRVDIVINKGATFREVFQLNNEDGTPMNLTGLTIKGALGASSTDPDPVDLNALATDPDNGRFELHLTHTTTATLDFYNGVYDVLLEHSSGDRQRVLEGEVKIKAGLASIP